jgi:hypothetical protein
MIAVVFFIFGSVVARTVRGEWLTKLGPGEVAPTVRGVTEVVKQVNTRLERAEGAIAALIKTGANKVDSSFEGVEEE